MVVRNRMGRVTSDGTRESSEETIANLLSGVVVPGYDWSGLGSTAGPKASDILNRQKFEYEMLKDQIASQQTEAKKRALADLYAGGLYSAPSPQVMNALNAASAVSEEGIRGQLASSLAGLGEGYGAAQELTQRGYQQLQDYLARQQADPFAAVNVESPEVTNALEAALQSQGAMSPDVQAQLQATNLGLQSGTQQFRNLLGTLSALNQQDRASRLAEAQMASNVALTGLGQNRAQYEAELQSSAMRALNQLAQEMASQRFQQEAAASAARDALRVSLAEAGIDVGSSEPTQTAAEQRPTVSREQQIQQIASSAKGLRDAVAQFAPQFVAANPGATVAEMRRRFPNLAAAVAAARQ